MKGVDSTFFRPAIRRVAMMLDDMEASLSETAWLAGKSYSLADVAFTPYVTRVAHLQQGWMIEARPKVAGWFDRVRARPAYKVALEDWFNPDFLALMKDKGAENRDGVKAVARAA
jgi:glutathione S-transferase